MANINFRELWRGFGWRKRSEIESFRATVYEILGDIDATWDNLLAAKKAHRSTVGFKLAIKELLEELQAAENNLQAAWGLKTDVKYHTYWMCPKACTCPKMDNMDRLGFGRIISADCPLHGKKGLENENI